MDTAQTFWNLLVNPNVAYLLLIAGLWGLMASFAVPGTGVPEVAAAICLTLAVMGLARLPVNMIGVTLIVISMIMLVIDLKVQSHGALTIGGITALALGSIFLFQQKDSQASLSLWVVAFTTLGSALFFGVALTAAMRAQKRPIVMDPQAVTGQVGEVRDPLDPLGTVQLRSELWSARPETAGEIIKSGTKIVVTGLEGLTLKVKQLER
jgi:membrane-bound serine protease (ClpP class)